MDRQLYLRLADQCLASVAEFLENFDPDEVDYSTADGVLKIEFRDGQTYVLNRQAGADQMWFAAGVRAWHYDWNGRAWVDDRDGHGLLENLGRALSEKLGRPVTIPGATR
jgi:CyaY protein